MPTFSLYLIRHGVAEERGEEYPDDSKRPLTAQGISRLRKEAQALDELGVTIEQIITSPLLRTRQTADVIAESLKGKPAVVTSDALSPQGTGVYGLAAASGSTVAVMTWNYQWTGTAAYDSRIVLTGFSGAFRTSSVRVTRYRVAHDVHAGGLNPVETFVIPPRTNGTYYSQTLPLAPNELRLLVLEPTRAP